MDPFVGKLGIFRVHQGTVTRDTQLFVGDGRKPFKVGHLFMLQGGKNVEIDRRCPGDLAAVAKVDEIEFDCVLHDSHDEDHIHMAPLLMLRWRIGLSPLLYFRPCVIPACASLLMAGAVWLLAAVLPPDTAMAARLAGKVVLGAGVYLGFIYLFDRAALVNFLQIVRHMLPDRRPRWFGRTIAAPTV